MGNLWSARRARAIQLLGQTPHAEEILTFYVELTEVQERVADQVPVADWTGLVRSEERDLSDEDAPPNEGDFPWLRVDRLPLDGLALPFRDFLSKVAEFGTETVKVGAQALLSQDDSERLEPIRVVLAAWGQRTAAKDDDFYPRAFLEPVITSIAQADSARPTKWTRNLCFVCGGPPQVATIRDLPDALGHRGLTCSMCATEWRFQRLTCPHCGEADADKLPVHTAESIAHVRVDACTTCSRYLKTVDLRKRGDAVPVVDELAAVELDIWAKEQGLMKLRANVLGL